MWGVRPKPKPPRNLHLIIGAPYDEKYDVELVYSNKNPNKTIIFIVDHNITCDARLVFFNKDLEEDYLALLNGERFDFSLAGQSYEDSDGGLFNTSGYTRFEL